MIIIICLILFICALVYIKIATIYNIVDKPNQRSSHSDPIIRGAGVLFYIAALLFFVLSNFKFPYFFLGLTLITIVSFIDDLVSLSPKSRLLFQFISITLVLFQIFLITSIYWVLLPLLLITGIGFVNVFNFMDGINGITGMYALVVFLGLYIINKQETIVDEEILIYLIISIVIFGFFNFRKKARFFCGDVGSISLAVILFFLTVLFSITLNSPIILMFAGVYLTDSILTIFYRKYLRENVTEAHRHHIYQKLTDIKKFPHLKTSFLYAIIQSLISIVILFSYKLEVSYQLILFVSLTIILILIYILLFKWLEKEKQSLIND